MFGLQILDIAIGLIFVYLLLALICTAVNELFAGLLRRRANNLFTGIRHLLHEDGVKLKDPKAPDDPKGKSLADLFYEHPLVVALHGKQTMGANKIKPSYIPSRTFALALLDIIAPARPDRVKNIEDIRTAIKTLPVNSDISRSLLVLLDEAENDLGKLHQGIEIWFNDAMDRVSGWYKQRTNLIIFVISTVITVAVNADSIQIAKSLANDAALRQMLVARAQELAKDSTSKPQENNAQPPAGTAVKSPAESIRENAMTLQNLGIKLGWRDETAENKENANTLQSLGVTDESSARLKWLNKIFGLLLTAMAVSLGAPFWFDTLNRIITIRAAGKSPKELPKPPEAPAKRTEEVPPK